jgi:predicted NBD/HSP70 family sugar kinase
MADKVETVPFALTHGALDLPRVTVDDYNVELRNREGFVGDRVSKRGFTEILEDWRERMRRLDADPLGDTPTEEISKKKLHKILKNGNPEAAGLIQGVIEDFAQELAAVIRRFLRLKKWRDTGRFVIGGGLRQSRIGELAIGRAGVLLKTEGHDLDLLPIRHHPDEAGLIGAAHLLPSWVLSGHDGMLAIDVGGSNIRAGIVEFALKKDAGLAKAAVLCCELWHHAGEKPPPKRDQAVERIIDMLKGLAQRAAKEEFNLAPVIGIGCPGMIAEDGGITRGGQNLPGNWESSRFLLPERIMAGIERIGEQETSVIMHNDAVVQGLSELPFMQDVEHWGALTIGTGLGNARYTNKRNGKRKRGK